MKNILPIIFCILFSMALYGQSEQLDIEGAIKIKAASGNADGTIEFGTKGGTLDYWGRKGGNWLSLTSGGSSGSSQWNLTSGILSPLSSGTKVGIGRSTMPTGTGLKFAVEGLIPNGWGGMSVNVAASSGAFSNSKPYYGYNVNNNLRGYHYWDEGSSEWRLSLSSGDRIKIKNNGVVTIPNLSGSGNRMVITDASGALSTQAISSGASDNLGNHTATMSINANNNKVTNVATPTATSDGVNKAYVDTHTDGDASPTNEIQTLSLSSNTLSISSGNSVDLSGIGGSGGGGDNDWIFQSGSSANDNIYRSGNVGLGSTTSPLHPLHVIGNSDQNKTVMITNNHTNGTAIEAQANVNHPDVTAIKGIANGNQSLAGKFVGRAQVTKSLNIGDFPTGITATAGEMRWNGSDFEGHDGTDWQSLTSSSGSTTTYAVGDFAHGGVVFWVNPSGKHGKVVSIYNVKNVYWSNITNIAIDFNASSIKNGAGNTVAIMMQSGHTNSAAQHCADLAYGGFDDWYLPSLSELQEVHSQMSNINPTATANGGEAFFTDVYWSSTQSSHITASTVDFSVMSMNFDNKHKSTNQSHVRAIRAF